MRKVLGILAVLLGASNAPAQFGAPQLPGGTIPPVPSTHAQTPYYVPYGDVRPVYSTFGGYPGYGGVYFENPIGSTLNGTANLVSAYGQYSKDYQQGRLLNQDVERSKLATRRAFIEQQQWEQSLQPTAEDIRRQRMELDLRRAMNDPPINEILSGLSLNSLLTNIESLHNKGGYGPTVPLNPETLRHINVTVTAGSNVAMFKDGGKLRFPFVLRDTPFDKDREQIQDLVFKAVKETQADELSPATLRGLKATTSALNDKVESMGRSQDLNIPDLIKAQRFVTDLRAATSALESGNATNSLNRKWQLEARSVGDLVLFMRNNGLRFAPALPGEESFYRSLHSSLVTYNYGTMQAMRR